MRSLLITFCLTLGVGSFAGAQETAKSEVMLFGVFHFANPGLDLVQADQIDVMSDENQLYLQALTQRISNFNPTHVLLECQPESTTRYASEYNAYLNNEFELGANENYQLGFRIAQLAGLQEVHCYDDRSVAWDTELLFQHMAEHEPEIQVAFDELISTVTEEMELDHRVLSFADLLTKYNSQTFDDRNKGLYLLTNSVGAGDNFAGANATASWWHRNFKMYANIQDVAAPNTRVIVIGGQGHTAIFRDLLDIDQQRNAVEVAPFLSE